MKKIVAILLALAAFTALALPSFAAECNHKYSAAALPATCIEKACTLYTCESCGHSYKVYADEFDAGEEFSIVAKSKTENNILTVTVSLYNNPGLSTSRLRVGYNADAIIPVEFFNGSVWLDSDFPRGDVSLDSNPISVYNEASIISEAGNSNNGTYFTIVFSITDPESPFDITFTHAKSDFARWDYDTNTIVKHTPVIKNLVGASDLGDHSYVPETILPGCENEGFTLYTCETCGDSYKENVVSPLGHSWEYSHYSVEPDFENAGEAVYVCGSCKAEKAEIIPPLERFEKGDVNGDGKISSVDSNLLKRFIVGNSATVQQYDAADLNGDGSVSSSDSFRLLLLILAK